MIDCTSVETMRQSDAYTIANLISGIELIRRAAYSVFRAVSWHGRTAIAVGSGNNGADGYALACILHDHGYDCTIFTVSPRLSADAAYYADEVRKRAIAVQNFSTGCLNGYAFVVDCLLGTGFRGALRESYRTAIEAINASDAYVVSVDINSGMDGDTGDGEAIVRSDLTVTIGFVKTGLISENAGRHIKRLICTDIGIVLAREESKIYSADELPLPDGYPCPPWLDMHIRTYDWDA